MPDQTPEITYPCEWTYTLIGLDAEEVRQAAHEAFEGKPVTIAPSRKSRTGKYVSIYVSAHVESQQQRDRFFVRLQGHEAIRMAL